MSTVTITNSQQVTLDVVPVDPDPLSAIVKYAQNPDFSLVLLPDLVGVLATPLVKAAATPASLGAQFGEAFNFGAGQPQLSIGVGATAAINVNARKNSSVFSDDHFKSEVLVKDGEGYLSLALTGSVTGTGSQTKGDITLGFQAGAATTFEYFRRFPVDATSPTVGKALGEVISHFVIPADVTDLAALRGGDMATCSGTRSLQVSAAFSAGVSAVPFATPSLPIADAPIQLNAGATLEVNASYEITSAWQLRARAVSDGVIELGFYKQQGSDWDIAVTASAGIDISLGADDLLTTLIGKLSKDPAADQQQLTKAGLRPDDIQAINTAISNSIDRSVHASLSLDLSGLNSDEAAFLYNVELDKLNAQTAAAVTAALDGDLTVLDRLNPHAQTNGIVAPGITLVRSILTRTKQSGVTIKVNFVGLFNFLSLADFLSKSQVIHEPISGDVVFTETASGQRIGLISLPQEQRKLRKLIFDSVLMTTTYRSGGALEATDMKCSAVHFALHSTTNEHTLSDYLDWFLALGLLDAPGKAAIMQPFHGTGASTCTARAEFDDTASKALFLDAAGKPKTSAYYVDLGRNALKLLLAPPPGDSMDSDGFRRTVLDSDTIWNQFDGQTTIGPVMRQESGWQLNDARIPVLAADYTVIRWWATAMSSTAGKVVDMQNFLKTANPATLAANKAFIARKADVQKHVLGVVTNSPMSFEQPFGLVALAQAAGAAAVESGILLSSAVTREFGAKTAAAR